MQFKKFIEFRSLVKEREFGFKKLVVWQKSVDLAEEVYKAVRGFPREESLVLVPQLLRCANSISANIAEGSFRRSKKEFIQFLYVAKGSLGETVTYFEIALRQKYFSKPVYDGLISKSKEVLTLLVGLINSLRK